MASEENTSLIYRIILANIHDQLDWLKRAQHWLCGCPQRLVSPGLSRCSAFQGAYPHPHAHANANARECAV